MNTRSLLENHDARESFACVAMRRFATLATLLACVLVALCCLCPSRAYAYGVERLAGADRYGTMEAIVQNTFDFSDYAVLASGQNFPDALAASSLAGLLGCPVLLTQPDELSASTVSELNRLGSESVYIVGGTSAISQDVEDEIARDLGLGVARIAGADRYETSMRIYEELQDLDGATSSGIADFCIIATGSNFADALSISPLAYSGCAPIFLAQNGSLSEDALQAIRYGGFSRVIIAGGEAVVSNDAQSELEDILGGGNVIRLAGADRYLTSVAIADFLSNDAYSHGMPSFAVDGFVVATGANYPDALCASALCGSRDKVLLLVDWWHGAAVNFVRANSNWIYDGKVVGGPNAVDEDTLQRFENAIKGSTGIESERPWLHAAKVMADDDRIGYSQETRCLDPNVDCSSFVYYSIVKGGVDLGQSWPFSTYSMGSILEDAGFSGMPYAGMKEHLLPGDVLVDLDYHAALVWNPTTRSCIEAGSKNPKDGDQDGTEVCIDYWGYDCDYDYVYRM